MARSAGLEPVARLRANRAKPAPNYFIGEGKVEELAAAIHTFDAGIILFNHPLSPSQERNLERRLGLRVLDRTGLILIIFALRARTHEGQLQVELAQLQHLSSRLVRGWSHLDRQKGGVGLRGAGETQLELDQRMLRQRTQMVEKRLDAVRKRRAEGRRARRRSEIPVLSLVGYTNSGKSTLFNALTGANAFAADQLFATLDSTLRRIEIAHLGPAILADTVGFIRQLPHQLVEAFRATLEESREADLLIQVIDCADTDQYERSQEVESVLAEIGADEVLRLKVYNKIDLIEDLSPHIERNSQGQPTRVWLSAHSGAGLDLLQEAVAELLQPDWLEEELLLTPALGRLRARLYALGAVLSETIEESGLSRLAVRLSGNDLSRLLAREGVDPAALGASLQLRALAALPSPP